MPRDRRRLLGGSRRSARRSPPLTEPAARLEIRIAAAVVTRKGRVLLRRVSPGESPSAVFDFPRVTLGADESWDEALARAGAEVLGSGLAPAGLFSEEIEERPDARVRTRTFIASLALAPGEKPRVLDPGGLLVWASALELEKLPVPDGSRALVARVVAKMIAASEEPEEARTLGIVAIALWGLPVTFTAAVVTMLALWEIAHALGFDLAVEVEKRFPMDRTIGGDRAVFLGVFLVYEAFVLGWAVVRNARGRGSST